MVRFDIIVESRQRTGAASGAKDSRSTGAKCLSGEGMGIGVCRDEVCPRLHLADVASQMEINANESRFCCRNSKKRVLVLHEPI